MKNRRRSILVIVGILIVFIALLLVVLFRINRDKLNNNSDEKTVLLDQIDGFEYTLDDRDSELFKNKFKELKAMLESDTIDYEEYAKLLSQLYIIDLYTLNNKLNKYDVGGTEYVFTDFRDNYELKVKDTIYKYIEDNYNGKRTQELPEVQSVEIDSIEETEFTVSENVYDAYEISLNWSYIKDLGYDTSSTIIIIRQDDKLYIVEQK